jgi:hypothetical protein
MCDVRWAGGAGYDFGRCLFVRKIKEFWWMFWLRRETGGAFAFARLTLSLSL